MEQVAIKTNTHPSSLSVSSVEHDIREERPLVSVVINFLDPPEQFFREAIDSVVAQTYDHWELLLVDDGSKSPSTALAREYEQKFPGRVRYLEHPGHQNRGMSASRNLGIWKAKGLYVAFLDADDVWLPHKLTKQVAVLESHPEVAMTYGGKIQWRTWQGDERTKDKYVEMRVPHDTLLPPRELIRYFVRNEAISGVCGILVRRDAARHVGGFAESVVFCEDQTLNYRIAAAFPAIVTSGQDWKYRRHPHSLCYRFRKFEVDKHMSLMLEFLEWVASFLRQMQIDDADIWKDLYRTRRVRRWQRIQAGASRRMKQSFSAVRGLSLSQHRRVAE